MVNKMKPVDKEMALLDGRGVMFPVAKTKTGRIIFASCAHVYDEKMGYQEMMYHHEDGTHLTMVAETRNMILPYELGADLVFVEASVEDPSTIETVRLRDERISGGVELHHVRNVMYKEDFKGQFCSIGSGTATLRKGVSFGRISRHNATFQELPNGKTHPGFKFPLKGLWMRSDPGRSGSPLWDKTGAVYGMVCGGSNELQSEDENHHLVYLPTPVIKKYLRQFHRNLLA